MYMYACSMYALYDRMNARVNADRETSGKETIVVAMPRSDYPLAYIRSTCRDVNAIVRIVSG